jgi:hypothetical protein
MDQKKNGRGAAAARPRSILEAGAAAGRLPLGALSPSRDNVARGTAAAGGGGKQAAAAAKPPKQQQQQPAGSTRGWPKQLFAMTPVHRGLAAATAGAGDATPSGPAAAAGRGAAAIATPGTGFRSLGGDGSLSDIFSPAAFLSDDAVLSQYSAPEDAPAIGGGPLSLLSPSASSQHTVQTEASDSPPSFGFPLARGAPATAAAAVAAARGGATSGFGSPGGGGSNTPDIAWAGAAQSQAQPAAARPAESAAAPRPSPTPDFGAAMFGSPYPTAHTPAYSAASLGVHLESAVDANTLRSVLLGTPMPGEERPPAGAGAARAADAVSRTASYCCGCHRCAAPWALLRAAPKPAAAVAAPPKPLTSCRG